MDHPYKWINNFNTALVILKRDQGFMLQLHCFHFKADSTLKTDISNTIITSAQ